MDSGSDSWPQWMLFLETAVVSAISGIAAAGVFVGRLGKDIEFLKTRVDELQDLSRTTARVDDIRRLEQHLDHQDGRQENFRNKVLEILLNDKRPY